ncbi:MAG: 8-amino-7-oxononanoate synthase [Geobacter sp.]|nr:8-amino-7-oxononanoate synthase [Geobacter sp.]
MEFIHEELERLRQASLYRNCRVIESSQGARVSIDGREYLLLCSNNYLGLAGHPALRQAAADAALAFGAGSGASRLVSGSMTLHTALEEKLALFKGTEAALLFNSGYAANSGIIPALAGRGDTVFSDRLNHASIVDGTLLSRASHLRYPHCDTVALRRLLEKQGGSGRKIIVTDAVFSMDGDMAPLQEIVALKKEFGAVLIIDDAHGTGVLGAGGKGTAEYLGVMKDIDVYMGTLGKGIGSYGAYVAGSRELADYLRNSARSFIFSTSLPPAVLAPSMAAIDIIDSAEGLELRQMLARNRVLFLSLLHAAGFDTMGSVTQIIPILTGDAALTMEFSQRLFSAGVFVQGIRPPTVPAGKCRLRCTVMASHTEDDLADAAGKIAAIGRELGVI